MKSYLLWLIIVTGPLYFFLTGIKMDNIILLYSSYLLYVILILLGLMTYNNNIVLLIAKDYIKNKEGYNLVVPEWLNFLALIISAGTLIYFERYTIGILLLISSYGTYHLYTKKLPYLVKYLEDEKNR